MSDPIPAMSTELVHEPTVANLSPLRPASDSLVRPSAPIAQIEQAFRDYTALCERLLVPDDYQQIGQKSFRKKSAWRKLATAFGVSVEMLWKEYERDGRHIIRAEVMSRAVAPNGRFMDGLGACDAFERCCENPCKKKSWNNHSCCTDDCNGFVHFSKPNHDIPATAMTRATNRACADLFGMGEVSAEEVTGDDHSVPPPKTDGWESAEQEAAAHREVHRRLTQLPEDHPARATGRELRERHGWPMPAARLEPLRDLLDEAEASPSPGGEQQETPTRPEGTETPEPPSASAPAPVKPARKARAEAAPAVTCAWCNNPIKDEAAVPVTFDGGARFMHARCKKEHAVEPGEEPF